MIFKITSNRFLLLIHLGLSAYLHNERIEIILLGYKLKSDF
jgi:hypothetical protein